MNHAISTHGLGKAVGGRQVVSDVSLAVPDGSVYGFLGPNGAGKTTTMRLLLGLISPDAGNIEIFGQGLAEHRLELLRRIGSFIEGPAAYDHLTGRQVLDIARRLLGLPTSDVDRVLRIVDMAGAANRRTGTYSLGMRQRLALGRALLGRPDLLLLDEPTNGLDPEGIADMRTLIRNLPEAAGCTVFVSSHLLGEVEQIASHVGLIREGRLVCQGPLDTLLSPRRQVRMRTSNSSQAARILSISGWEINAVKNDVLISTAPPKPISGSAIADANRQLVEAGISVLHLSEHRPSLEDLYRTALQPAPMHYAGASA